MIIYQVPVEVFQKYQHIHSLFCFAQIQFVSFSHRYLLPCTIPYFFNTIENQLFKELFFTLQNLQCQLSTVKWGDIEQFSMFFLSKIDYLNHMAPILQTTIISAIRSSQYTSWLLRMAQVVVINIRRLDYTKHHYVKIRARKYQTQHCEKHFEMFV